MSNDRNAPQQPLAYGSFIPRLEPEDTNDRPVSLVIHGARRQNMAPEGRTPEVKIILTFQPVFPEPANWNGDKQEGRMREYVVNSTSYKTLCSKLGRDDTKWVGRTVAMEPVTSNFDGAAYRKTHVALPDRWEAIIADTEKARAARGGAPSSRPAAKSTRK